MVGRGQRHRAIEDEAGPHGHREHGFEHALGAGGGLQRRLRVADDEGGHLLQHVHDAEAGHVLLLRHARHHRQADLDHEGDGEHRQRDSKAQSDGAAGDLREQRRRQRGREGIPDRDRAKRAEQDLDHNAVGAHRERDEHGERREDACERAVLGAEGRVEEARRAEAEATYQKDYQTALADYNVALRHLKAPADRVRSLVGRAACLTALDRATAAEEAYTQALLLDPTSVEARLARGELRLFRLHQHEAAIGDFNKLLRSTAAEPTQFARAIKCRGIAYYQLHQPEAASHDFIAALSADDTDGQTYYLLGRVTEALGQRERAAMYFAAAQARGYQPSGVMQ